MEKDIDVLHHCISLLSNIIHKISYKISTDEHKSVNRK